MTTRPKLTAVSGETMPGATINTGTCCECSATFTNDPGGDRAFAHAEATGHTTISYESRISHPEKRAKNRRAG